LCGNREVGFVLPGRSAKREIRAGFVTTDMLATFSLGCGSDACFWPQHGMSVMSRTSSRVEELIDLDAFVCSLLDNDTTNLRLQNIGDRAFFRIKYKVLDKSVSESSH
jgi:hypothetical protein